MKARARRVGAFRRRLATQQASWAIELPALRRITLELTAEQQAVLQRATRQMVPSVTLVLTSAALEPNGHALACLELAASGKRGSGRSRSRRR